DRGPPARRLDRGQGAQSHRLPRTRRPCAAGGGPRPANGPRRGRRPPRGAPRRPARPPGRARRRPPPPPGARPGGGDRARRGAGDGPAAAGVRAGGARGLEEPRMTYTFGLDTFGDRNGDADGKPLSHAQTIRNVAEEGVFAEQAGVDFFGIGEHHTGYFPMPAGDVVLAAIAARTERIRLG